MYNETRYKKRLHRYRPFILLGNEIDGRVNCELFYTFNNLTSLKKSLPDILVQIKGEGEWVFELYQVPKEYKIWHRWGYYKYPNRGTKLLKYSYMNLPMVAVRFYENEINFVGAWKDKYARYSGEMKIEINRLFWDWK